MIIFGKEDVFLCPRSAPLRVRLNVIGGYSVPRPFSQRLRLAQGKSLSQDGKVRVYLVNECGELVLV